MGEYVNLNGESIKLGTCENLYYVTYDEMVDIAGRAKKQNGNLDPKEYLKESNGFRYRFPFPYQHYQYSEDEHNYDMGYVISAPVEWKKELDSHQRVCFGLQPKYSHSYNINAFVTCPMSPDARPENYSQGGTHGFYVEVIQQKIVNGCLWSVVRCPYCGAAWRLERESVEELATYHSNGTEADKTIIALMLKGYDRKVS